MDHWIFRRPLLLAERSWICLFTVKWSKFTVQLSLGIIYIKTSSFKRQYMVIYLFTATRSYYIPFTLGPWSEMFRSLLKGSQVLTITDELNRYCTNTLKHNYSQVRKEIQRACFVGCLGRLHCTLSIVINVNFFQNGSFQKKCVTIENNNCIAINKIQNVLVDPIESSSDTWCRLDET